LDVSEIVQHRFQYLLIYPEQKKIDISSSQIEGGSCTVPKCDLHHFDILHGVKVRSLYGKRVNGGGLERLLPLRVGFLSSLREP
jgi:hypothetical protein